MIRGVVQNVVKLARAFRGKESSALMEIMESRSNRAVVNAEMTKEKWSNMVSRFKSSFPLLLVVLAIAVAFPAAMAFGQDAGTPTATPTIKSDLEDYPPGATVTLTGSGWQPGETVDIFVDDDQTKTWVGNFKTTADANGNITYRFQLPDWFVATYQVRATGAQSGVATTSFTDAAVDIQGQDKGSVTWRSPSVAGWAGARGGSPSTDAHSAKFSGFDDLHGQGFLRPLQEFGQEPRHPGPLRLDRRPRRHVGGAAAAHDQHGRRVGVHADGHRPQRHGDPVLEFRGKLAAGAHNFTGNSLAVGVDNGGGNLSIAKPAAAPGNPDLAVTKTGPTGAGQGDTLTYTLNYQNKSSTTDATGTQLTDRLPAASSTSPVAVGRLHRFGQRGALGSRDGGQGHERVAYAPGARTDERGLRDGVRQRGAYPERA
jgi:uncharacterized repeat protein (TIGR01451 family)